MAMLSWLGCTAVWVVLKHSGAWLFVCVGSGDAVAGDKRHGSWHQSREELFIDFWEAVNGTIELCGEAATVYTLALGQAPQIVIGSVAKETPA